MSKMVYGNDKKSLAKARELLANFSDRTFSADQGVAYHADPANQISLPNGMTPEKGSVVLSDVATAMAQEEEFSHVFKYRPWDGAHALREVMIKFFGTTGRGKTQFSFFGSQPPQQISIETGPNSTERIPWGVIEFAPLEGRMALGGIQDAEYGILFRLQVVCPKRYGPAVDGLFNLIEMELRENSIYRGKAFRGVEEPKFIDVKDNSDIVYNGEVEAGLNSTVWGVIENAELMKLDGRRINKRVLLYGPYGTGKSEAGVRTAKIATDNEWTFIQFHSGKAGLDELEATVATARLYQPAVVFIEDIDVYAAEQDSRYQTRLSNLFDGINSKNDEVMLVMTSNRAADFSKGMLRAGRVDRMIEIGPLDKEATERLIKTVIGEERLAEKVDYDKVWDAVADFEPAFVRQTFDQAAEAALIRTGSQDYVLDTEDFVTAANLLRPQHEMHSNKSDAKKKVTIEDLFRNVVENTLTERLEFSNENIGDLSVSSLPVT